MKFTNKVKIVISFGKDYGDKIIFYGQGNTEVRGDEKQFIIIGEFDNERKKDEKNITRNTE